MTKGEREDKELVDKILEGDTAIFKVIISNTERLVINIIYKMITNSEDRKDLIQEVYLKVYSKLSSFKFNSKLSTWIGTITYNTCLSYLAKKKIPLIPQQDQHEQSTWESLENQFLSTSENQSVDVLIKKERQQIVSDEIEKLPPLYRIILTLFHKQELSYKEIANITNLPEGTLKSYLNRARKQLKINLLNKYKREDL